MSADRLRVAMSSYYLPSESKIGAGYQAHGLAKALVRHGHAVTMFSPCARPEDATYEHVHVPLRGSLRSFQWPFRIRRFDLSGFDVFHAAGDDYLLCGKTRPVHVCTLYGSCLSEAVHITGLKDRLRMVLLGVGELAATLIADRAVCISANTRRCFPWVQDVIPCGVDLDLFSPGPDRDDTPIVLFVGTFERRKRGRMLMEVFARDVRPVIPDAELWMVSTDAPTAPGVSVLGRVSDESLADLYRRAWVFCLPSTYEGFGVPYLEAMASGLPVVATPNPGALELTENGRLGVIAKPTQLGQELVRLLRDEAKRDALAAAGRVKAADYSWDKVATSYSAVYLRLLSGRGLAGTDRPNGRPKDGTAHGDA